MKIFQIVTLSELGGAQTVVINLSNALSKEHAVTVIAGEGDGKLFQMLNSGIAYIKVKYLRRKLSPLNDIITLFYFILLFCKYKPDIIHLHSSKAGILGRLAFPKKKIIYTVHGFDSIRLAYRKFLPIEKYLQKNCKAIVAVSNYDEKNLISENIIHNVKCIYNGIENKMSSVKYRKTILCIARNVKPKRLDVFLETAKILKSYAFVWIGNQEIITNMSENVFFMGNIPNAGRYNQLADLFMLSSDYEGLPITIIEAMSYGNPIVASDVGGIGEIVINDENGYTVENTAIAFAEKIRYILENTEVYQRFSENSLRLYNKYLTAEKMVQGYKDI